MLLSYQYDIILVGQITIKQSMITCRYSAMNKKDFHLRTGKLDEHKFTNSDETALTPQPSESSELPLNNFFGNDFLNMLWRAEDDSLRALKELKQKMQVVANDLHPDMQRAAAAVEIGLHLKHTSGKGLLCGLLDAESSLDWFELAASLGDVRGHYQHAVILLAKGNLRTEFSMVISPIPELQSINANINTKRFHRRRFSKNAVSLRVAERWSAGIRLAMRAFENDFKGWNTRMFNHAIACVVNYLCFYPVAAEGDEVRQAALRLKDLDWIISVWDALIDFGYKQCPEFQQSLLDQKSAVLIRLKNIVDGKCFSSSNSKVAEQSKNKKDSGGDSVVVITDEIPPAQDRSDVAMLKRYEKLSEPIRLVQIPEMAQILSMQKQLLSEFPWAEDAVELAFSGLKAARGHGATRLRFSPILLVGGPGTGKTRFATRFAHMLNTPVCYINMAGMRDTMLIKGSTRGWASARPSRVVEVLAIEAVANPIIILDEVDKARPGMGNGGDPQAALLDLLEPENASKYMDQYIMAPCDLSHCLYIATANTLETIPEPLMTRFRPVLFPQPRPEHSAVIVQGVLRDMESMWSLPAGTLELSSEQASRVTGLSPREIRYAVQKMLSEKSSMPTMH